MDPTPEAPKWDNKRPNDDDDEITEVLDENKPAEPPKKKKKKKKNKDPKEAVPTQEGEDDGTCPSTLMVETEDVADEATPVPVPTEVPAEETKAPKKKKQKKKDAELKKFRSEQREAKAKEMSKIKHRKLQHEQDFWAVRNYRKSIPDALLGSINGADHRGYLLGRFQKENNYMSKKCGHKWNLMTVERLLTHIAKYANEPTKHPKEAQQIIKSNFPMVQGMPSGDKCTPEFAMHVLMDCEGNLTATTRYMGKSRTSGCTM